MVLLADIGVEDPSQPEKQSSQAKGSSKGKEAGSQKRKAEQKAFGSIKSGPGSYSPQQCSTLLAHSNETATQPTRLTSMKHSRHVC